MIDEKEKKHFDKLDDMFTEWLESGEEAGLDPLKGLMMLHVIYSDFVKCMGKVTCPEMIAEVLAQVDKSAAEVEKNGL